MSILNEKIKELRLENGLKKSELAKYLGVTKRAVADWESGNSEPPLKSLCLLADLFAVSTDYLLGREKAVVINTNGLSRAEISHISMLIRDLQTP